jgi:hypothetical protein
MRQRGRKSAANLVTLNVNGTSPKLVAPAYLRDDERTLFVELIGACSPNHFVESDMPLLVSYIQSTLLSRSAAAGLADDPSKIIIWEKATRMQAMLATRLRLAPQARTDPKTIGRYQPPGRPPWEPGED